MYGRMGHMAQMVPLRDCSTRNWMVALYVVEMKRSGAQRAVCLDIVGVTCEAVRIS